MVGALLGTMMGRPGAARGILVAECNLAAPSAPYQTNTTWEQRRDARTGVEQNRIALWGYAT